MKKEKMKMKMKMKMKREEREKERNEETRGEKKKETRLDLIVPHGDLSSTVLVTLVLVAEDDLVDLDKEDVDETGAEDLEPVEPRERALAEQRVDLGDVDAKDHEDGREQHAADEPDVVEDVAVEDGVLDGARGTRGRAG